MSEQPERIPFQVTEAARVYQALGSLPVSVLLDNVRSMYNVGSFFRTMDGAGAGKLFLSGITGRPPKPAISKTALGAEELVPWEHAWDPVPLVHQLHQQGYEIAALETRVGAVDLYDWVPRFPVCLMFGHEVDGLQPELLDMADTFVRVPMLGHKHSLNVATAGGIVLYELLRKYRELHRRSAMP